MTGTTFRDFGIVLLLTIVSLPSSRAQGPAAVLTWHNDNARTGQIAETTLTAQNVSATQFGKLFSYPVDGQIYAQPLYAPNVNIAGVGVRNVVYVATEHDSVYAFDADRLSSSPLWHISFIDPSQGITSVSTKNSPCDSLRPEVGISATPVIDATSGTLYVTVETKEKGKTVQRLHALNVSSGVEKFGGPVLIQASVSGVAFDPSLIQRTGLLLSNGVVYMSHASLCDPHPYHGWILGYDAHSLLQTAAFVTTPNGNKGGIWQSGGGLAADSDGNIFAMDGDGTFDANTGGSDYGMSMMKLTAAGGLSVADYFTPYNEAQLSRMDRDLGSGGLILLPPQNGKHPNEVVGGDKEGKIFVVDRDNMGKFNPKSDQIVQTLKTNAANYFSSPTYWQHYLYYSGALDYLSMYSITNGVLSAQPISHAPTKFAASSTPSISIDSLTSGIIWTIETFGNAQTPAVLHAYNATDVSKEIYNSNQSGSRDVAGPANKFAVPTIANGKVYIGTQTEIDVYGLLSGK